MARIEYSPEEWRRKLGVFIPAYNQRNATSFNLQQLETDADGNPISIDYSCDCHFVNSSAGEVLKIQWTEIAGTEIQRNAPQESDHFRGKLRDYLDIREVRGVEVHFGIRRLPAEPERRDRLAWMLAYHIAQFARGHRPARSGLVFGFSEVEWSEMECLLRPWFDRFEICRNPNVDAPTANLMSWSDQPGVIGPTTPDAARVALDKKLTKYRGQEYDLDLVIEFSLEPAVFDDEVAWVRSAIGGNAGSFRSVWIVRAVPDGGLQADCVYSMPTGDDAQPRSSAAQPAAATDRPVVTPTTDGV